MRAYERLLKYVTVRTPSDETSTTVPSSACQFDLAQDLIREFINLGLPKAGRMKNAMSTHRFLPRRDMKIVRRSDLLHIWILFLTSVTRRSFRL